ncbi:hypothetical protein ACH4L5_34540 [Streptomyces sp. NPDC017405]|uniref:hypothetical protein n=1 Tax=unclassified Streptomyces TaxID=2593676 RepID=UPI0037A6C12B
MLQLWSRLPARPVSHRRRCRPAVGYKRSHWTATSSSSSDQAPGQLRNLIPWAAAEHGSFDEFSREIDEAATIWVGGPCFQDDDEEPPVVHMPSPGSETAAAIGRHLDGRRAQGCELWPGWAD